MDISCHKQIVFELISYAILIDHNYVCFIDSLALANDYMYKLLREWKHEKSCPEAKDEPDTLQWKRSLWLTIIQFPSTFIPLFYY